MVLALEIVLVRAQSGGGAQKSHSGSVDSVIRFGPKIQHKRFQ